MRQLRPPGIPIADVTAFLEEFATAFVEPKFRDRFVHEAVNKPLRLASRICHSIEEIFSASHAGDSVSFDLEDLCVPISGTDHNFQQFRWADLAFYVGRGAGLLIASADATQFYAETETEVGSPYKNYSASRPHPR